jgi:Fe-S-cluster containining protein
MGSAKDKPAKAAEAFECRRCGVCCTMHQAFVTTQDIERITAHLGLTLKEWDNLYDDSRWQYSEYRLIRHINGACAFLTFNEGLAACKVHSVKPACCERWQAGTDKRECREGMGKALANEKRVI